MEKSFYSNGKLLITGEYVVLDGALSLALPVKYGQYLNIENGDNKQIVWESRDHDETIWFSGILTFSEIINKIYHENQPVKNTLTDILHEGYLLNPDFINLSNGYKISTKLTFPKNWGLGTSSTLIHNIAQWLQIEGFTLLKNSFGGSGYDIACAQVNSPILYKLQNGKPTITPVPFAPTFKHNIYFVYLNQKQNSKEGIALYRKKRVNSQNIIPKINSITQAIVKTDDLTVFKNQLTQHEDIVSELLGLSTIKETLFPDFDGTVKSLGAWGGDFVMAIAEENPISYFKTKGYNTVLPYKDLIL